MDKHHFKAWILQFDKKEAFQSKLDENPLFIRLSDNQALIEHLFPQYFALHWNSASPKDLASAKEHFLSELFYKLPAQYDKFSAEAVCDLIRQHSYFYPSEFYYNGALYTADIESHRVIQWNLSDNGH